MTGNSLLQRARKLAPLLVVATGLLAYHNSFTGSYFHDDFGSIPENPTIRHLWPIWQPLSPPHRDGLTVEGRPLINLSLAINYALGGYNVWGYHALNLTVHILAGLTLLGVVRRTLLQPRLRGRFGAAANELALATAVLWTVHPLQTESVTYIVQRAESIMGLFYLLTLYCFIRGAESQRPGLWYSVSVAACALGMACKEVMASAPVMVLLYDRMFVSGSFREAWRRRRPLYLGLFAAWILLGWLLVQTLGTALIKAQRLGLHWWEYLATEPGVILYYLRLSMWPSPLRLDAAWPIARTWMGILPPTVVVLILLGAVVWTLRRNSAWGFVGAWFFLILAPSSSFIPLLNTIYEHRMYLSLAAVVGVVVMGLYSVAGRHSLAVFAVVAIGLGFLTWRRNQDYRRNPHFSLGIALQREGRVQEAISQFEQAQRFNPDDAEAHFNLGTALEKDGRLPEAMEQYEQAVQINPDYAEAHNNLGVALARLGRVPEAMQHYERALAVNPDHAGAHENLGNALLELGEMPEAIGQYEQALRLQPDSAAAHYNLGVVLVRLGRMQEAVAQCEQALRLRPDYAEAHYNLGVALMELGRVPEAITQWEDALRLKPDYAAAHYNLGIALVRLGKVSAAIAHWEQALQLKPDYAEAHFNLGVALVFLGKSPEAIAQWEQALRINPDYAEAHYNLGIALEQAGRVPEAIAHWERVLQIKPDYAEARKRLATFQTGPARSESVR